MRPDWQIIIYPQGFRDHSIPPDMSVRFVVTGMSVRVQLPDLEFWHRFHGFRLFDRIMK